MQELEKILEEIRGKAIELKNEHWGDDERHLMGKCVEVMCVLAEQIIRKHMNDGWIPVEKRLPEDNSDSDYYESVIVTLLDGRCAPGVYRNGDKEWWVEAEDGEKKYTFESDVIAWCPLPESYRPENDS